MSGRGSVADEPPISVLIPVRDGAAFLAAAIESARSQSYRRIEVVVVDDGSKDGTADVARAYGSAIVFERREPAGTGAARNRAVELSTGDLLAFLDADDVFEPERLRRQGDALLADPSLDAVFGRISEFVEPGLPDDVRATLRPPRLDVPSHLVTTMLIRRAAFERVGPFAPDQDLNATIDWTARALSAGLRSVMLDAVVLRRRLHSANVGVTRWDFGRQLVGIARASVERRRMAARDRRGGQWGP
jgi:glycosyltransferase involved in cell wall biosynthesis